MCVLLLPTQVTFVNAQGLSEAGLDHGGLMKELLESVVSTGTQPEYGLFASTEDSGLLYPNPTAEAIPQGLPLLEFLGVYTQYRCWGFGGEGRSRCSPDSMGFLALGRRQLDAPACGYPLGFEVLLRWLPLRAIPLICTISLPPISLLLFSPPLSAPTNPPTQTPTHQA